MKVRELLIILSGFVVWPKVLYKSFCFLGSLKQTDVFQLLAVIDCKKYASGGVYLLTDGVGRSVMTKDQLQSQVHPSVADAFFPLASTSVFKHLYRSMSLPLRR